MMQSANQSFSLGVRHNNAVHTNFTFHNCASLSLVLTTESLVPPPLTLAFD